MQSICVPDTPIGEIATNVADWGGVHLKDVIALRDAVAFSAAAVDYYISRRLPAGNSSILCNVPKAATIVFAGRAASAARPGAPT